MDGETKTRKRFSQQFKVDVLKAHAAAQDTSIEVGAKFDVAPASVVMWRKNKKLLAAAGLKRSAFNARRSPGTAEKREALATTVGTVPVATRAKSTKTRSAPNLADIDLSNVPKFCPCCAQNMHDIAIALAMSRSG